MKIVFMKRIVYVLLVGISVLFEVVVGSTLEGRVVRLIVLTVHQTIISKVSGSAWLSPSSNIFTKRPFRHTSKQ